MELAKYDGKYVRVTDKEGKAFTGKAKYADRTFISSETGGAEEGIFIEDCLIYGPQIVSIEETEVHGTVELRTEKQVLRRYRPEDADILYRCLGTDPEMSRYSGWNPYATPETARETVCRFIATELPHFFRSRFLLLRLIYRGSMREVSPDSEWNFMRPEKYRRRQNIRRNTTGHPRLNGKEGRKRLFVR